MFITGHIIRETQKAILVSQSRGNTDGGDVETWLPKSQTNGYSFLRDANHPETYITVPEWLVASNGLDAYDEDHPIYGLPVSLDQMKVLW